MRDYQYLIANIGRNGDTALTLNSVSKVLDNKAFADWIEDRRTVGRFGLPFTTLTEFLADMTPTTADDVEALNLLEDYARGLPGSADKLARKIIQMCWHDFCKDVRSEVYEWRDRNAEVA